MKPSFVSRSTQVVRRRVRLVCRRLRRCLRNNCCCYFYTNVTWSQMSRGKATRGHREQDTTFNRCLVRNRGQRQCRVVHLVQADARVPNPRIGQARNQLRPTDRTQMRAE
eukprot:6198840-Pleurochrysis_carterae.AAC.4